MRYISLKNAKTGMRLAYDVYDSYGRILVGANTPLSENYIERLLDFGFDGVYISDDFSEDIEIEAAISPQLRAEGLQSVRNRDVDMCMDVAKKIVEEILDKGNISLDLTDLRTYDDYTYAHSVNVAVISCIIGMGYQLPEEDLRNLVIAALLHDFGKLLISPDILNKPGRLTPEEYAIIKTHSRLSYELICERWDLSAQVKNAVLFHHENVDGTGYPNGITGEEQTLLTKILHVADVYDALVSKRPYKEPYSPKEAIEYLMGGCGFLFDKEAVEMLMCHVPLYPKGTEVILSDGRKGIIFDNCEVHNLRPVVKLYSGELLDLSKKEYLSIGLECITDQKQEVMEGYEEERKEMIKDFYHAKVMVVDDMKSNLQVLNEILKYSYEVILMKSGSQALTYLEKKGFPDLILLDIDMPEMDGIETAERMLELTKGKVPIIFVTALCDRETVLRCRQLKVSGYIVRPYKPVYVRSEIKRILEGRSDIG